MDARGVYFGPTGEGALPELIPWSWVDRIVTFDRIVHSGGSQKRREHYVGVELNATGIKGQADRRPWPSDAPPLTAEVQEFTEAALMPWLPHMLGEPSLVSRKIGGWRLDARSLAEAVMRYAPDTPIVRRPTRRDPGIAGIAATAWQVRENLHRLAERDDHKNDDDQ
ncbi:hypothetical protein [Actinomadura sp. GTD37]|uniref:hypothetical protein n=1 Tax=Actinomadura sp. GTD37 TaxID=1778030 RepID=UPI0035C2154F